MARKANRFNAVAPVQQTVDMAADKTYRTALYARLSVELHSRPSDSINTQLDIMREYVKKHPELSECREYVDSGYSGTNFERPSFNALMEDIKDGKINCILVKDLSRFGRDYLETTNFIEVILPFLGVRFISVNDHFDTDAKNNDNKALEVALKNLVNDMYAKDVSKRVSVVRRQEMERGRFVGSFAPYGYKISKDDPLRHLVIDEEAAAVVKDIFRMASDGKSLREISIVLQERNLSIPKQYLNTGHLYQEPGDEIKVWSPHTLSTILKNQAYIGNLVQGKYRTRLCDNEKRRNADENDWVTIEGSHEPVVSREVFDKAAMQLKRKIEESPYSSDRGKSVPIQDNKYKGILFCGKCGSRLQMKNDLEGEGKNLRRRYYYRCCNSFDIKHKGNCRSNVTEIVLDHIVAESIKKQVQLLSDRGITVDWCERTFSEKLKVLENKVQKAEADLKKQEYAEFELHERYGIGQMSREELEAAQEKSDRQIMKLREKINDAQLQYSGRKNKYDGYMTAVKAAYRANSEGQLDGDILSAFIERIVIHPKGDFEIYWKFEKGFQTDSGRFKKREVKGT